MKKSVKKFLGVALVSAVVFGAGDASARDRDDRHDGRGHSSYHNHGNGHGKHYHGNKHYHVSHYRPAPVKYVVRERPRYVHNTYYYEPVPYNSLYLGFNF